MESINNAILEKEREAWIACESKNYAEASRLFEDACVISEGLRGPDHDATLQILDGLALVLDKANRHKEAAECNQKILSARLKKPKQNDTLQTRSRLAQNMLNMEENAEAARLLEINLDALTKKPESEDLYWTRHELSRSYFRMKEYPKAADEERKALEVGEKVLGRRNHALVTCRHSLGNVLFLLGRMKAAKNIFSQNLELMNARAANGDSRFEWNIKETVKWIDRCDKSMAGPGKNQAQKAEARADGVRRNAEQVAKGWEQKKEGIEMNARPNQAGGPSKPVKNFGGQSASSDLLAPPGNRTQRSNSASAEDRVREGFKHVPARIGGSKTPPPPKSQGPNSPFRKSQEFQKPHEVARRNAGVGNKRGGAFSSRGNHQGTKRPGPDPAGDGKPGIPLPVGPAQDAKGSAGPPLFDARDAPERVYLQSKADSWIQDLEDHVHPVLDKYKDFKVDGRPYPRVRIAILDTGIAKSAKSGGTPELIRLRNSHIRKTKSFVDDCPANQDENGHGTHAAGILLKVAPNADIYVARVLRGNEETISHSAVAAAIRHATDDPAWKVDIISISFGWKEDSDSGLREAIQHALSNNVLIFAAASNDGLRAGVNIAYPARAEGVIHVSSAKGDGTSSFFNPEPHPLKNTNFTAVGEAVLSAWPLALNPDGEKRMSGTSFATPVAAGVAALVLEFARQPPLSDHPRIAQVLKTSSAMDVVFKQLLSKQKDISRFSFISPRELIDARAGVPDGGDAEDRFSTRSHAASALVKLLQNWVAMDIVSNAGD